MRIAAVQTSPVLGEKSRNLAAAMALLGEVRADLAVLPELFDTGYAFSSRAQLAALAEPVGDGPTAQALCEWTAHHGGWVLAGFAERDGERLYNSAMLVGPAGVLGLYRKLHLFGGERALFDPGTRGLPVLAAGKVRLAPLICYDWAFAEVARSAALRGAQLLAHPANLVLPWGPAAMVTRAVENHVFTLTANRVGREVGPDGTTLRFIGCSQIVAPDGTLLAQAGPDEPGAAIADIEPVRADDKRLVSGNDLLADRRFDVYGDPALYDVPVLHEDAHLLIVDKPAGLAVHPGTGPHAITLVEHWTRRGVSVWPVHRIDAETSGIVVLAKNPKTAAAMGQAFASGNVRKHYVALVAGRVRDQGTVMAPLKVRRAGRPTQLAEGLRTHYRRVVQGAGLALLWVRPQGGRTHQIRRHLAHHGHPLVADRRYGPATLNRQAAERWNARRLCLHAARLQIDHPVESTALDVVAPLPADLAAVFDSWHGATWRTALALPVGLW